MSPKPEKRPAGKAPAKVSKSVKPVTTIGDKAAKKKGRHHKRAESYSTYIFRVLKQVHPGTGMSNRAMAIMNSFVYDIFERIANESSKLVAYNKKSTISSFEIQAAGKGSYTPLIKKIKKKCFLYHYSPSYASW